MDVGRGGNPGDLRRFIMAAGRSYAVVVLGSGPIVAHPACLGCMGDGPGLRVSVSVGGGPNVAWFPLGPREVYVPTYRASEAYVTRVNVTNVRVERTTIINVYRNTNTTNVTYVNQRVGGAVTVVSHDTFVNAQAGQEQCGPRFG